MKRFTLAVAALTGLLLAGAAPDAVAGHGHGAGYGYGKHRGDGFDQRRGGHRHDHSCDHGPKSHARGARHGYQPFHDDRAYGVYRAPRHRGRYDYRAPHGHRHQRYPVASTHRAHRHHWRWCEAHGGWFRIGDFVLVY